MDEIIQGIIKKSGCNDLLEALSSKISASELNSLLLEVFRRRAGELSPAQLLKNYDQNRFAKPAKADAVSIMELSIGILKAARSSGFLPLELSPVAPLGACSAIARTSQNKIVSALRGTEVLADATNSIALHICSLKKAAKPGETGGSLKFCSVHRHTRAQNFKSSGNLPHFALFCMVSEGLDTGSYTFELESIAEHIGFYTKYLGHLLTRGCLKVTLRGSGGYADQPGFLTRIGGHIERAINDEVLYSREEFGSLYYQGVQFKISVLLDGVEHEIVDGGFVDWAQKLLGNNKERLLISGLGIERLFGILRPWQQ